ncbi:hypothetical protein [Porcincola intestinalis]|uniref:hypothetical protein n=1 Tax=Porcincola intestinalis TaxID=2606632 RepID=UPI002A7F2AAB|nr:hypothetical protein [Porcincola intestinalis]MDY4204145.1 hypothetical protein [Porcincola intestinalis]
MPNRKNMVALFSIAGHLIGTILGIFGWLILSAFVVTLFGLVMYAFPVILSIGVVSLFTEA